MYYNLFNVAKIKRNIRLSNESNKAFDRDVNSFQCNFMPVNVILCLTLKSCKFICFTFVQFYINK